MLLEAYRQVAAEATPRRRYPQFIWRGIAQLLIRAETAITQNDPKARHEALMRAQTLVGFLDGGFRDDLLPEGAPALHEIHARVVRLMARANLTNNREALELARDTARVMDEWWGKAADAAGPDLEGRWSQC